MHIIWRYIRPLRWWVVLSLVLAGVAQILTLVDPLIFGMIVDEAEFFVHHPIGRFAS